MKELVSTFNKEKDLVVGAFSGYYEKFFKVHQQLYLYQGDSFLGDFWGIWDNNYDDSGFNAIRLLCSGGEVLKSAEGVEGDWTPWKFSTRNISIDGVYIRSERPCNCDWGCGNCDNTATNGLRFIDTDGWRLEPYEGYWNKVVIDHFDNGWLEHHLDGYWSFSACPKGKVFTGFRTQVHRDQGDRDDTGLNRVQFKCDYHPQS